VPVGAAGATFAVEFDEWQRHRHTTAVAGVGARFFKEKGGSYNEPGLRFTLCGGGTEVFASVRL